MGEGPLLLINLISPNLNFYILNELYAFNPIRSVNTKQALQQSSDYIMTKKNTGAYWYISTVLFSLNLRHMRSLTIS